MINKTFFALTLFLPLTIATSALGMEPVMQQPVMATFATSALEMETAASAVALVPQPTNTTQHYSFSTEDEAAWYLEGPYAPQPVMELETCPICLTRLDEQSIKFCPSNHRICKPCLRSMVQTNETGLVCPLCRQLPTPETQHLIAQCQHQPLRSVNHQETAYYGTPERTGTLRRIFNRAISSLAGATVGSIVGVMLGNYIGSKNIMWAISAQDFVETTGTPIIAPILASGVSMSYGESSGQRFYYSLIAHLLSTTAISMSSPTFSFTMHPIVESVGKGLIQGPILAIASHVAAAPIAALCSIAS